MAPKGQKRETAQERAARLNRNAAVTRERADYVPVSDVLRLYLGLVNNHKRQLMDSGHISDDGTRLIKHLPGYKDPMSPDMNDGCRLRQEL